MIVAYATTSDNTIGAGEGISVLGFGTAFAEISEPVTMAQGPDLVLDKDAADALLRNAGWQRIGDWTHSGGQYAAKVESI